MAKWPYNTANWKRLRLAKLARNPLCEHCALRGKTVPAKAVDHIVAIAKGGHPFPAFDELAALCIPCHSHKTNGVDRPDRQGSGRAVKGFGVDGNPLDRADGWHTGIDHDPREFKKWGYSIPHGVQPSRIPVVLICGAPGSGKTTYANQHAAKGDTIIDLDDYRVKVGGKMWDDDPSVNARAFAYRSKVIHGLSTARWGKAWLIAPSPTTEERDAWRKALVNVSVVVMDVTLEECLKRLYADERRGNSTDRLAKAVRKWYGGGPSRTGSPSYPDPPRPTHEDLLPPRTPDWSVF